MSARPGDRSRPAARRHTIATTGLVALCLGVAGCTSGAAEPSGSAGSGDAAAPSQAPSTSSTPEVSQARVSTNLRGARVPVDREVKVTVADGTFEAVAVTYGKAAKALKGTLSKDRTRWTADARLEPGTRYRIAATAVDADGVEARDASSFRTQALTLDQQTYPNFSPLDGETVGVGMPVVVSFDVPIADRAAIEKKLTVTNTSGQRGAWHWISDSEVHWRPATYWKPGTDVTVKADVNSVAAGNGIYGQLSRSSTFHVGDAVISRVNARTHRMKTYRNGTLIRTTPITTGKAGFTTRSGVKVIMEKFRTRRMNSETVGISRNSPEAYDIDDVEYAMRVTNSGEFLHAAPWSVGSQGRANVSHGCTGMSTANAAWIYNISKRGDVVEYVGTNRQMTLDNGYGDWNASFDAYRQGSALG